MRKKLASELTSILNNTRAKYAECQARDRMEQARDGAENIRGGFVYGHNREAANNMLNSARSMALYAVDKQIKNAEGKLTDAPSTDEANYITAISGRTDYTRDEMNAALSRYKSHSAQKAIINAAKASKLVPASYMTKEEREIADLRDLRADIDRTYSPFNFEKMSDGAAAMTNASYNSFANGGSSVNALDVFGSF